MQYINTPGDMNPPEVGEINYPSTGFLKRVLKERFPQVNPVGGTYSALVDALVMEHIAQDWHENNEWDKGFFEEHLVQLVQSELSDWKNDACNHSQTPDERALLLKRFKDNYQCLECRTSDPAYFEAHLTPAEKAKGDDRLLAELALA